MFISPIHYEVTSILIRVWQTGDFFFFEHLYWSIIALQWCVSFCFIAKWISYTYTLASLSPSPYPTPLGVTKHWADLPVLCDCFPLASYFTFGSMYKSMPLSHFVPAYTCPSPCPQIHSLRLHLYSCPAPRFIRTIFSIFFFRFQLYVLGYGICFSLSHLLHSVWQILGPSTSLQITQFRFFLWLSNIPLYMCATSSLPIYLWMDT